MSTLANTYQLITNILSFEISDSLLEQSLKASSMDWDAIVIVGSKHVVLPAIYCRLKAKNLLHVLPQDLNTYLEDLSIINRNRNKTLLKEAQAIATLLNKHAIEHVFLKGSALLAKGCYNDNAERMVGDIDVLIKRTQLQDAFELIKSNGYGKTLGYNYQTIGFRHLDRLISDNHLAAIELHDELLVKNSRHLIDLPALFKTKRISNGLAIANDYYLSKHQIFAWQINDKGHYYKQLSFKTLYDSIVLDVHKNDKLLSELLQLNCGRSYLSIAQHHFAEFSSITPNLAMRFYAMIHQSNLDYKSLRILLTTTKHGFSFISHRIDLLLFNKHYRMYALKRIFFKKKA